MSKIAFCLTIFLTGIGGQATLAITCLFQDDRDSKTGSNRPDEPLAEKFSIDRAAKFLDATSLKWQKQRKCMTCHTNYAYLYARPAISSESDAHGDVRAYAESLVNDRWEKQGPRWDAEVIATAAALAYNDAKTTGKLHDSSRKALDRMWSIQQSDGGFDWLKCGWPPMESDDHYGVTLAAIAVGVAPDAYARTDKAKNGMEAIRKYLAANPAPTLHHRAMMLWADSCVGELVTKEEKRACVTELKRLQKKDGGWGLATLGDWKRADGKEQDLESSDGYATGFVIFVLRQSGEPVDSPYMVRGINWLKSNQRQSGRWFTRSLNRDNKHFISHAGSAFAIMALDACGQLK